MTYYPAIDALRAVAVLSVVLYHAGFTTLFGGGYIGVDIFFVISGYLISSIIYRQMQAGTFSFVDFYTRRVRRIMPALFVCLAVTTIAASQILIQEFKAFCGALVSAVLMAANIWFCFNSGYFDAPAKTIPLLHTWSLGVEEQFYLVFPVLMLLSMRKPRTLFFWLTVCFTASFAASVYYVHSNVNFAFYSLHTRAWELLAGSLLAVHGPFSFTARQCRLCIYAGLGILGAAVVGYGYTTVTFPGFAAIPPVLGAVLCIVGAISCKEEPPHTVLHTRPMIFVGLISYSLYLWHWPVLVLYKHATEEYALPTVHALALVALIFALAWLSWKYVEIPVRSRRVLARPAALYAACGFFALVLVAVGGMGYKGWLEDRLPPKAKMYAEQAKGRSSLPRLMPGLSRDLQQGVYYFGKENVPPTVLLLGDSHADALGEVFDSLALEHGESGLLVWGLSPLMGAHKGEDRSNSRAYQREMQEIMRKYPSLRKAVLVLRWAHYTEGYKAHEREEYMYDSVVLDAEDGNGNAVVTDVAGALEYGLRNTVTFLRDAGMDVWVMHGVPEQNANIPRRAARLVLWGVDVTEAQLGLPLAEHRQRNLKADALLGTVMPDASRRLNPTDALCGARGPCRAAVGDTLLYYDDDHLSVAGSMQLRPLLDKVFTTPPAAHGGGGDAP